MNKRQKHKRIEIEVELIVLAVIIVCAISFSIIFNEKVVVPIVVPTIHRPIALPQPPAIVVVPKVPSTPVAIAGLSPQIFAYAHGTVMADKKIFIGLADRAGNPYPSNQIYIFSDLNDLNKFNVVSVPKNGDVESMVYDEKNDKIYFPLSDNDSLSIYRLDPQTYAISSVFSTTSIDIGAKPAIVTDGKYIYGITYNEPATVFKVSIDGSSFESNAAGHISKGHSAAIGIYSSTTELYFGGGEDNQFENVDGDSLDSLGITRFRDCFLTDDMPYKIVSAKYGYVYVGCEKMPYGYRVKTDDMSSVRFDLPGASFGLFIYNNDLYNAAQDGNFDIFKGLDISKIKRYYIGQDIQLNELFVSDAGDVFFTGWWGVKGLLEVASTSLDNR